MVSVDASGGRSVVYPAPGAVAQLGERCNRTAEVRGSIPLSSMDQKLPLGVTGNTPDSGSGESWFEPRRGNGRCESTGRFIWVSSFGGCTASGSSPGGAMAPATAGAVFLGLVL